MRAKLAQFLCQVAVVLLFSAPALLPLTGQPAIVSAAQTEPR